LLELRPAAASLSSLSRLFFVNRNNRSQKQRTTLRDIVANTATRDDCRLSSTWLVARSYGRSAAPMTLES
jgi:hypothetical protein